MKTSEIERTMKTRGLFDLYLPTRIAYHVKIVLGSIAITMFFSLLLKGNLVDENFWFVFGIVLLQLEIFMFIALRIFSPGSITKEGSYKKQILIKLIKFYLLVMVISFVILLFTIALSMVMDHMTFSETLINFIRYQLRGYLLSSLLGATLGALLFFYLEWNHALTREQKLREEKLIFQYETLKNQVNPHFLFNSLNTLSSLVSQDPKLSEMFISNLSGIYRYILENRDVELINLTDEIAFVERFFLLQKIRDNGKIELHLDLPNVEKYQVLPISIQLLVENALKHNAATKQRPLSIRLSLKDDYVIVENSLQPKMHLEPSSNLGLKNLRERVNLILNKEVIVDSSNGIFSVKIPLKSK